MMKQADLGLQPQCILLLALSFASWLAFSFPSSAEDRGFDSLIEIEAELENFPPPSENTLPWPTPQHQETYVPDAPSVAEEQSESEPPRDPQPVAEESVDQFELGLVGEALYSHSPGVFQNHLSPILALRFAPDIIFFSKINFIDGGVDRHPGGSSPQGEILLESAFLEWSLGSSQRSSAWAPRKAQRRNQQDLGEGLEQRFLIGLQLLPMGLVNPTSEPNSYLSVQPPETETFIIPQRWSEMGVLYTANHGEWLSYRVGVFNSLDSSRLRPDSYLLRGTQGGRAKAKDLSGLVGLQIGSQSFRLGGSYLYGHTGHGLDGLGFSPLHLYEVNFSAHWGSLLHLSGLFTEARLSQATAIEILNNTSTFGLRATGFYVQAAVDLLYNNGSVALPLFVRLERYNLHQEVAPGETPDPRLNRQNITYGLNWQPRPQLTFKLDYQDRRNRLEQEPGVFSLGLSFVY